MLNETTFGWQQIHLEKMPKCYLCHNDGIIKRIYPADRYQNLVGIKDDTRVWYICESCRLMWQTNCLTEDTLKDIYSHYRDTSFRNETLEQIFDRVDRLSPSESENHYRYHWFSSHVGGIPRNVLDIGSGFGIWPNILRKNGWKVVCTEPNQESCDFINNVLKIKCINSFSLDDIDQQFDVVSLVHVLEHIRNPKSLLEAIRGMLVYNGKLFVEVPDQTEFSTLDLNNDEFNSTHLWFFDVTSLYTLLSKSFRVTDIHRVHYENRGLYRILAICQNIE